MTRSMCCTTCNLHSKNKKFIKKWQPFWRGELADSLKTTYPRLEMRRWKGKSGRENNRLRNRPFWETSKECVKPWIEGLEQTFVSRLVRQDSNFLRLMILENSRKAWLYHPNCKSKFGSGEILQEPQEPLHVGGTSIHIFLSLCPFQWGRAWLVHGANALHGCSSIPRQGF